MDFRYPKNTYHISLGMITAHRYGRGLDMKFWFFRMRLMAWFKWVFFRRINFISAYYLGNYELAYKAALLAAPTVPLAASLVAHMLAHGEGCEQDMQGYRHWARVAAEGGEPEAMAWYAGMIENQPDLSFRLLIDSFKAHNEYAAIKLLEFVVSSPVYLNNDAFLGIKEGVLGIAQGSANRGFTPAVELLRKYEQLQSEVRPNT